MKNNFLQHIEKEKRQSQHTLTAYRGDLDQFEAFISENYQQYNLETVNHLLIRNWLVSLIEAGLSPVSVKRKISSLNAFYKFLKKEQCIKSNPMQKIIGPKTGKKLPVFLDEHQMDLTLNSFSKIDTFESSRNRLVIEMIYTTGVRLSEFINLKLDSINESQRLLKVLGKGNKERIIPYTKQLALTINHYLFQREELLTRKKVSSPWLLLTNKGQKSYPKLVYKIVKNNLAAFSTNAKRSPHVLRHTFATSMLNGGAGLNTIKEFLGHCNLSATQIYTHNSIEKLQNIYKQAHPRA